MDNRLFTLKDTADRLSVSVEFLQRLRRAGGLQIVRLGRAVRVPQSEVERLLKDGVSRAAC